MASLSRTSVAGLLTLVAACLAAPSAAMAQSSPATQPGVHAAPGSPAGKEYAIPVDSARSIGGSSPHHASTPHHAATGGSTRQAPAQSSGSSGGSSLFGAGITPAASSAQSSSPATSAAATHHAVRHHARHHHAARRHVATPPATRQTVTQASSPVSSGSAAPGGASNGVAWMIALGLGAIVVGSGAGLALRARR